MDEDINLDETVENESIQGVTEIVVTQPSTPSRTLHTPAAPPTHLPNFASPSVTEKVAMFNNLTEQQNKKEAPTELPDTGNLVALTALFNKFQKEIITELNPKFGDISEKLERNFKETERNRKKIDELETKITTLTDKGKKADLEILDLTKTQSELEELWRHKERMEELETQVNDKKVRIDSQQAEIADTNSLITDQAKEIDEIRQNPSSITQEQIEEKVQEALTQHQLENVWQRKLDETQNQLVFKNLRKNPNTANLHPRQIFIDNILTPMRLNPEDEQKITPITVIDVNKEKPDQSSHLLICTFSSIQAISLLKQNARKIPRAVRFNTRVPTHYQPTLNEHLKIQGQLRQMRNSEGNPLVKTRLNTDRGHILLEVSDRVADGGSPFRTRTSFMPQSRTNLPQTTTSASPQKYTLLQYKWETPLTTDAQNSLKQLLSTLSTENASFNHTNHVLNITIKHNQEATISSAIARNPNISSAILNTVAH